MRLRIKYASKEKGLLLPLHYNSLLQAWLYNTFSNKIAKFLHREGFSLDKRHFKLFVFSRILEKGEKVHGKELTLLKSDLGIDSNFIFKTKRSMNVEEALYFRDGFSFYFSSPKNFLIEDMARRTVLQSGFVFLNQNVFVESVEVLQTPTFSKKIKIKMLSPVAIYTTIETINAKKLTYYYSPHEKEFSILAQKNAEKKYILINGVKSNGNLKITPLYFNEKRNRSIILLP